ncbi:MAG: methyltransferase domain-containing protein [Nitrospinota bacterium]|nr:methyltransferase domain-containing protein [Nitrospinota bacterium]
MTLTLGDIRFHESSYVDPNGFLFIHNDEIYRGIKPDKEDFYRNLLQDKNFLPLKNNYNLIESQITDHSIPEVDCSLVLKHRRIEPTTFCTEWCPSMLKDAAIATLELNLALLERECMLQDAYPWNILFEGSRPVHVDLTSIVPSSGPGMIWPAYQQYMNFFMYPLRLASMNKGSIARLLLQNYIDGISLTDFNKNLTLAHWFKHPLASLISKASEILENKLQSNKDLKLKIQNQVKNKSLSNENSGLKKNFVERLIKKTEKIALPSSKDNWTHYYQDIEDQTRDKKKRIIDSLLAQVQPGTLLDLGCNIGAFSILAAKRGVQVISMDSSESCIEALYKNTKANGYSITPVVGNILNPPSTGFLGRQFPSMVERFKSDTVLCLGLMHHLHIHGRQSFERIAALMNTLSNHSVIFEYVAPDDDNNHLIDHGRKIEYTLETVSGELSRYFNVRVMDSDRDTRKILLCEKR